MSDQDKKSDERLRKLLREAIEDSHHHMLLHEILERIVQLESGQGTFRCQFSDEDAGGMMKMLTGGGNRKEPLKDLRTWLGGAEKLVIADPYFMHGNPSGWDLDGLGKEGKRTKLKAKANEYAEEVNRVLGKVKHVDIYHLPGPTTEVRSALKRIAFEGRYVRHCETTDIHDRVWIKDGSNARIIGTSFGGLGEKLAFMIPLPSVDLIQFQEELKKMTPAAL